MHSNLRKNLYCTFWQRTKGIIRKYIRYYLALRLNGTHCSIVFLFVIPPSQQSLEKKSLAALPTLRIITSRKILFCTNAFFIRSSWNWVFGNVHRPSRSGRGTRDILHKLCSKSIRKSWYVSMCQKFSQHETQFMNDLSRRSEIAAVKLIILNDFFFVSMILIIHCSQRSDGRLCSRLRHWCICLA